METISSDENWLFDGVENRAVAFGNQQGILVEDKLQNFQEATKENKPGSFCLTVTKNKRKMNENFAVNSLQKRIILETQWVEEI